MSDRRIIDMTEGQLRTLVAEAVRAANKTQPVRRFLTCHEAAGAFSVSPQTIRNWAKRGAPVRRIGGGDFRIDVDALVAWRNGDVTKLKVV